METPTLAVTRDVYEIIKEELSIPRIFNEIAIEMTLDSLIVGVDGVENRYSDIESRNLYNKLEEVLEFPCGVTNLKMTIVPDGAVKLVYEEIATLKEAT